MINSFDIFDTLLVRGWAHPSDLFLETGARLGEMGLMPLQPEAWRRLRMKAEMDARNTSPGREVTLVQIYAQLAPELNWGDRELETARVVEMEVENSNLSTIPAGVRALDSARKSGRPIAFLSDMYLTAATLQSWLEQRDLFRSGDLVLMSGDQGCSKADGGLFRLLSAHYGVPLGEIVHHGDHSVSDAAVPRRLGCRIVPLTQGRLSPLETRLAGCSATQRAITSRLAAASRLTRLDAADEPEPEFAPALIRGISATVVGPLLLGYVHWILSEARNHGIQRLYFVSRDGQILLSLAEKLKSRLGLSVELRYLYGSRLAWFLPGWSAGLAEDHDDRSEEHADVTDADAADRKALARAYLQQEGLEEPVSWAMVDLGWRGRLQAALGALLKPTRERPVTGFYFALDPDHILMPGDRMLTYFSGRIAPLWTTWPVYGTVLELFASADHGQVTGYHLEGNRLVPTLRSRENHPALDWGLRVQQETILAFADHFLALTDPRAWDHETWKRVTTTAAQVFLQKPTREEADLYGQFPVSPGLTEDLSSPLAPRYPVIGLIRSLLRSGKALARIPWPEGSIVRSLPLPRLWLAWLRGRRHLKYRLLQWRRRP
jgi:FMN phosphatase YigB (HAD superfamily)